MTLEISFLEHLGIVFPLLDVNHTRHLALKQQKRANRDEEGPGKCPSGGGLG